MGWSMAFEKTKRDRIRRYIFITFPFGLMLSPDALSFLGNRVGVAGPYFLSMLFFGVVVPLLTALSYGKIYQSESGPRVEATYVKEALGGWVAFLFPVYARIAFTVCVATGILATAGYAFNELFLRWFPNLGFSFLILAAIFLIGWRGEKAVIPAQVISMGVVVFGLLVLSFFGLLYGEEMPAGVATGERDPFSLLHLYATGLVFFVGFELSAAIDYSSKRNPAGEKSLMVGAIVFGGLLLAVWGAASLIQVAPNRLTATSVPYSVAAREILGDPGRKMMGLMIISASFGFTNAILTTMSGILSGAAAIIGLGPNDCSPGKWTRIPLVILFMAVLLMLSFGMAGEPHLEVFARAGIYLWLLNYSVVHLAVLTRILRSRFTPRVLAVPSAGLLLTFAGTLFLVCFDAESIQVLKYMAVYLGAGLVLSLIWVTAGKAFFTLKNGG